MKLYSMSRPLLIILGCFSLASCKDDVNFIHYSRSNSNTTNLTEQNLDILQSNQRTVFIVHGWMGSGATPNYQKLIKAFLKKGGYNVVMVDWSQLSYAFYFTQASVDTKLVGQKLGNLIVKLESVGIKPSRVHIVGHSLGAHIAGFAGQTVKKKIKRKIGRISGLDPASPKFSNFINLPDERLSDDDAKMVDIVHTDCSSAGMVEAIGTIDFYPNGGFAPQPNCLGTVLTQLFMPRNIGCSHTSALYFFTESILTGNFYAMKCEHLSYYFDNCKNGTVITFGLSTPTSAKGSYFFDTNVDKPYARGRHIFDFYRRNNQTIYQLY